MINKASTINAVRAALIEMEREGYKPDKIEIQADHARQMLTFSAKLDVKNSPFFFVSDSEIDASVVVRSDWMVTSEFITEAVYPSTHIAQIFVETFNNGLKDAMVNGGPASRDPLLHHFENGRLYFRRDYNELRSYFPSEFTVVDRNPLFDTEIVWVDLENPV